MLRSANMFRKDEEDNSQDSVCSYSIENPRKKWLVFDCERCQEQTKLASSSCLKGVLEGLSEQSNIDGLILSDYKEKAFEDETIEVLNDIRHLIDEMEDFSMRTPALEREGDSKGSKQCQTCKYNPENVFSRLQDDLLRDITEFYDTMEAVSRSLKNTNPPERICNECMRSTEEDLIYLFNSTEDIREKIYRYGFGILI